ncbi:MAG TPA: hypothetical protein DCE09_08320 [Thermoanaerobacter sp.]|nr:hypothetical protein [Thermoanaerobacter sp.]
MVYFEFEEIGNLIDVDVAVTTWERIILREREGEQYLVSGGAPKVVKPPTTDYNFMLSLINLVKVSDVSVSFEGLMNSISFEAAAKWVQENGFPEVEHYYLDGAYAWLSLSRFRREVVTLWLLFHLWLALLYEDEKEITRYLQSLAARNISDFSFRRKKITAQQFISDLIDQRLKEMQPRISAYLPNPRILLHTNNLFTVAYFQLALLITQKDETKGKNLKVCPIEEGGCGNLFWGHGNRKFCPLCDRRTAYSRRKKKNKNSN